ncbi:hypothetical protein VYU27_008020, partial [Nannochloropsis oceanica]
VLEHYRDQDDPSLSSLASSLASSLPSSPPGGREAAQRELVGLPPGAVEGDDRLPTLGAADTLRIKSLQWLRNPRLHHQSIVHLTAFLRRAVAARACASPDERDQGVIFSEAFGALLRFGKSLLLAQEEGGRGITGPS